MLDVTQLVQGFLWCC